MRSRRVDTEVTMNMMTKGKTPSREAPIESKTGVGESAKIHASRPSRTHGTRSMSATVRWSCLSWDRIRPAVASVMRGFMPHSLR